MLVRKWPSPPYSQLLEHNPLSFVTFCSDGASLCWLQSRNETAEGFLWDRKVASRYLQAVCLLSISNGSLHLNWKVFWKKPHCYWQNIHAALILFTAQTNPEFTVLTSCDTKGWGFFLLFFFLLFIFIFLFLKNSHLIKAEKPNTWSKKGNDLFGVNFRDYCSSVYFAVEYIEESIIVILVAEGSLKYVLMSKSLLISYVKISRQNRSTVILYNITNVLQPRVSSKYNLKHCKMEKEKLLWNPITCQTDDGWRDSEWFIWCLKAAHIEMSTRAPQPYSCPQKNERDRSQYLPKHAAFQIQTKCFKSFLSAQ